MNDDVLRKLQLTELDILKKVDAVCTENHLTYFLVGGTLLGAIRHKGFIPWDDDLDIAMPRKDYDCFAVLCKNGALGKDYYFHHTSSDNNYWLPFAKVRKKYTLFDEESAVQVHSSQKGIFIDVFPLDYCKKPSGTFYHMKARLIKRISKTITLRVTKAPLNGVASKICNICSRPFSIKTLSIFRDKICKSTKQGDYYINYGSNYKYTKQTMPISIYEPAVRVKFEDGEFLAPHEYEQYLVNLFGDWKKLPPEEERRNHNPVNIVFDTRNKTTDNLG